MKIIMLFFVKFLFDTRIPRVTASLISTADRVILITHGGYFRFRHHANREILTLTNCVEIFGYFDKNYLFASVFSFRI